MAEELEDEHNLQGNLQVVSEGFEKDLVNALREVVEGSNWQCVGPLSDFVKSKCTVLYAEKDSTADLQDNVALFCVGPEHRLYAMDTLCPHEGGPLELGDIEDLDGVPTVYCPWHHYDFNLKTGYSSTGLEQQTYGIKIVDNKVYINIDIKLSKTKSNKTLKEEDRREHEKLTGLNHMSTPLTSDTLCDWAVKILHTPVPEEKVSLTFHVVHRWQSGDLIEIGQSAPPEQPGRVQNLTFVAAGKTRKLGKAGSLGSRVSLIHSLANIEQWAIDLSWDIIARFSDSAVDTNGQPIPRDFFSDFVKVAADEAKHYKMLAERLVSMGSHFGALPVHNGLWQSAQETSHSLLSRLAIVHMVHEARGLDVHPKMHARFVSGGDKESATLLEVLYKDEITHVAAGIKWFSILCDSALPPLDKISTFHDLVKKHFRGYLKPPFDTAGREEAGMPEAWYVPLVKPS